MAYKSIKYELCVLKVECTNLAKEFTTAVFLDVKGKEEKKHLWTSPT